MSPDREKYLEGLGRLNDAEAQRRCAAFFAREALAHPHPVEFVTNELGQTFARAVSQSPSAPDRSDMELGPAGAPFPPLVAEISGTAPARESLLKRPDDRPLAIARAEAGADVPARASDDVLRARWAAWMQHVENRAGAPEMAAELAESMAKARRENQAVSVRFARRMADAGARTIVHDGPRTFLVDPFMERVEELPALRRINFFPCVAAARRNGHLQFAEHYLRPLAHRTEMFTFTAGPRVFTPEVRDTISAQHSRLGELARQRWFKSKAELVWRGTELGGLTLSERSSADLNRRRSIPETLSLPGLPGLGPVSVANPNRFKAGDRNPEAWIGSEPLWHVHTHAIVVWAAGVSDTEKKAVWNRCRLFWGFVCDRSGRLEKIREAVKYPAKPVDVELLTGPQMVALAEATARLKIVLPRAGLRRFRAETRERIERLAREFDENGEPVTVVRPDWNSKLLNRSGNRKPVRRGPARTGTGSETGSADPFTLREKAWIASQPVSDRSGDATGTDEKPRPVKNRILAACSPAPIFGAKPAPVFVVWNFDGDFAALRSRARVARTCAAFARARATRAPRAAVLGVHTRHPTCTAAAPPGDGWPPGEAPEAEK